MPPSEPASTHPNYTDLSRPSTNIPRWTAQTKIRTTSSPSPQWKPGDGALDAQRHLNKKHIEIDPFGPGRPMSHNYTLLISGIVPRPIGLVSTLSVDGHPNLAPFSYFQCVDHDPPVFVVGFSGRAARPKDTLANLEATRECTINVVSERMIDAVNACSLDAPIGVSEWAVSGLHQAECTEVRPARVRESVFSIEGRLCEVVDFKTSRDAVGPHGRLAIIEGIRFWVREDAVDEERRKIDLDVLRPVGQLGGISYARVTDTFELARSNWKRAMEESGPELARLTQQS